mmetsp:Transcript_22554/g.69949  ORF Transcript_22554/g.69949 Transcript_22554/m.69949 type:complete len:260 (-) Transcript_22554:1022-1801(-)
MPTTWRHGRAELRPECRRRGERDTGYLIRQRLHVVDKQPRVQAPPETISQIAVTTVVGTSEERANGGEETPRSHPLVRPCDEGAFDVVLRRRRHHRFVLRDPSLDHALYAGVRKGCGGPSPGNVGEPAVVVERGNRGATDEMVETTRALHRVRGRDGANEREGAPVVSQGAPENVEDLGVEATHRQHQHGGTERDGGRSADHKDNQQHRVMYLTARLTHKEPESNADGDGCVEDDELPAPHSREPRHVHFRRTEQRHAA